MARDTRDIGVNELWTLLLTYGIVSEETLQIVTDINGYTVDTLNDVLYAATGYRTIEQYEEEN